MNPLFLMLRGFGIDPEDIARQVEQAKSGTLEIVERFDKRLDRIEQKLDAVLSQPQIEEDKNVGD